MPKPIDIRCPKCSAAPTAKCLENTLWGSKFINTFHDERITASQEKEHAERNQAGERGVDGAD